jgi:DNA-binding XRE family transcriptional regulator
MNSKSIPKKKSFSAIAVYLEKRKTRILVGKLHLLNDLGLFEFVYNESYLHAKSIIPLGPEFPLTQRVFRSAKLFPSLIDRIPSKENPAYKEYCQATGIDVNEEDPIILLGTIGKKGPSSFVFEPLDEDEFTKEDLIAFRKELGLTTREFATCFDLSQAALTRIENGHSSGNELLKRIKIYKLFPEVALFEIMRFAGAIDNAKKKQIIKILKSHLS